MDTDEAYFLVRKKWTWWGANVSSCAS